MAFIDPNQQSDTDRPNEMDTLGNAAAQPQGQAPTGDANAIASGGSNTIGSQSPNEPKKGVGSGNYTNIKKYQSANMGAGQNMAKVAAGRVERDTNQIGQQVAQQKSKFEQKVAQNRQAMDQAGQFGQQQIQQAGNLQSQKMVDDQRSEVEARKSALGTLQAGGYADDITGRTQQNQEMAAQIEQQNQAVQQSNQAQAANEAAIQSAIERTGLTRDGGYRQENRARTEEEALQYLNLHAGGDRPDTGAMHLSQNQDTLANWDANRPVLESLQNAIAAREGLQTDRGTQRELLQRMNADQVSGQDELLRLQNMQGRFDESQRLDAELAGLPTEVQENLAESDVQRFRNLLEGRERFDTASLNVNDQMKAARDLQDITSGVNTSEGRKAALRNLMAGKDQYSRGQASLDSFLVGSDQDAVNELIGARDQATVGSQNIKDTQRQALRDVAGISQDQATMRQDLTTGVETGQADLRAALEARALTGEGTFGSRVQDALASGRGLSEEDAAALGIGNTYGSDVGSNFNAADLGYTSDQVANLNDMAQATGFSQLAGQTDQDIILDPSKMGQITDRERAAVLEAQSGVSDAKGVYDRARSEVTGDYGIDNVAYNDEWRSGIQGQTDSNISRIENAIRNAGGLENLSPEERSALVSGNSYASGIGQTGTMLSNLDKASGMDKGQDLSSFVGREDAQLAEAQGSAAQARKDDIRRQALEELHRRSGQSAGQWTRVLK